MPVVLISASSVSDGPISSAAAAVRGLPDAAAVGADVGNNAAVGRRSRINRDGVDATLGRPVIEAAGATSHVLGLRAQRRKGVNVHRERRILATLRETGRPDSKRNAARNASIVIRGALDPLRIENAGRIRDAIEPFLFHPIKVVGFAARDWHIALQLIGGHD